MKYILLNPEVQNTSEEEIEEILKEKKFCLKRNVRLPDGNRIHDEGHRSETSMVQIWRKIWKYLKEKCNRNRRLSITEIVWTYRLSPTSGSLLKIASHLKLISPRMRVCFHCVPLIENSEIDSILINWSRSIYYRKIRGIVFFPYIIFILLLS